MKIEIKTADTNGKITLTQGIGFLVVPYSGPAAFPLEAHPDGAANAKDTIAEVREVKRGPFSKMELWGAVPKSEWLCYTLESDSDSAGPRLGSGLVRILGGLADDGMNLAAANVYYAFSDTIGSSGFRAAVADTTQGLVDVSAFRSLKMTVMVEGALSAGGGHCKVGLWCRTNTAVAADPLVVWAGGSGSGHDFVSGPGTYTVDLGEGIAEAAGAAHTGRSGRWKFVQPVINVTTADVQVDGGFVVELWGVL